MTIWRRRLALAALLLAFFSAALAWLSPCGRSLPETPAPFVMRMLDVGKADCLIFVCDGHTMLVDAGLPSSSDRVLHALADMGVASVDTLVATHPDKDHVGGLAAVLAAYPVGRVLRSPRDSASPENAAFLAAAQAAGAEVQIAQAGEEFALGRAVVRVLQARGDFEESNDCSVALSVAYEGCVFLLTGDLEKQGQDALLQCGADLSAQVLKVPYHGTSALRPELLQAVSPALALVPSGPDGGERPVSAKAMDQLMESGAVVLRSDQAGDVDVRVQNGRLEAYSSRGKRHAWPLSGGYQQ